ncbi:LamG domain-containing protein [uncultured Eudoraea sp.]|uniref:LamG domain-containing protein n=1 Tax=uncultured Eudoraea sp. TaxID=1035614 RepID=UPI00262C2124|nr:LamG domain-containing protein [uncultured Eudoraea sp.]
MNRHLTIFFSITIILLYSLEVLSQKSINLNGVTDYIAVDNNPSLSIEGNFTIEAWIKPNDITGEKTILIKGNNGQCGNYGLFIKDGNLAYVSAGECGWNGRGANSSLTVGIWQHVAVATDNNIIRLYIDGALRDEITLSSTVGSTNFDELWIGRSVFITTNFFFDGLIDEVRIWDTSKSHTDIENNLNTE